MPPAAKIPREKRLLQEAHTINILGNGPGTLPSLEKATLSVILNPSPRRKPEGGEIFVSNAKHAGLPIGMRRFAVEAHAHDATWCTRAESALGDVASALKPAIGCEPSTGLVVLYWTLEIADHVSAHRMPLRPSLVRTEAMSNRSPLACAFHNWLGERRLALEMRRGLEARRLEWPSLELEKLDVVAGVDSESSPLLALLNLFRRRTGPGDRDFAAALADIACIDTEAWFRFTDSGTLRALEPYFFLVRQQRETTNWWLYSNECSTLIDTVLHKVMLCQQYLSERQVASAKKCS